MKCRLYFKNPYQVFTLKGTREEIVANYINRIQKLSEEDRELIKDLLEKQAQFRELEFAGEYC